MADESDGRPQGGTCEHGFYGSVTVGDRGQIVIPAALRREYAINAGDRLLVFRGGPAGGLLLAKIDLLHQFLQNQLDTLLSEMRRATEEQATPEGDAGEAPVSDGGGER